MEIMDKLEDSDDENVNFDMFIEGTKSINSDDSDSLDEGENEGKEENKDGGGMETEGNSQGAAKAEYEKDTVGYEDKFGESRYFSS